MGANRSSMQLSQSQDIDLSKRQWKGMKEISVVIERAQDTEEVDKLAENLNEEKGYKIKLILSTFFQDDTAANNFFGCIEKLNKKEIYYLKWSISGTFTDQTSSKIGDLIGRIIHLYSLELNISGGKFEEQGSLSLARCFKKLSNLHVLKLFHSFYLLVEKERKMKILKAIQDIKTLETLDQDIDRNWQIQQIIESSKNLANLYDRFNNLSTFIYLVVYLEENSDQSSSQQKQKLDSLKKNLNQNKNMISKIIFFDEVELMFGKIKFQLPKNIFYYQSLSLCFTLPYLTSFKNRSQYGNQKDPFSILLKAFLKERKKKILELIVFYFEISNQCCFNPQWALNDLNFD